MTTLTMVNDAVRKLRELELRIEDAKAAVTELNKQKSKLQFEILPEMFLEVGTDRVGVAAEGNLPGYDARLEERVHANILASWSDERRDEAFSRLEELGLGDIIGNCVEVYCDSSDLHEIVKVLNTKFVNRRRKRGDGEVTLSVRRAVPWKRLTSAVKSLLTAEDSPLDEATLKQLGATVSNVVTIKIRGLAEPRAGGTEDA